MKTFAAIVILGLVAFAEGYEQCNPAPGEQICEKAPGETYCMKFHDKEHVNIWGDLCVLPCPKNYCRHGEKSCLNPDDALPGCPGREFCFKTEYIFKGLECRDVPTYSY